MRGASLGFQYLASLARAQPIHNASEALFVRVSTSKSSGGSSFMKELSRIVSASSFAPSAVSWSPDLKVTTLLSTDVLFLVGSHFASYRTFVRNATFHVIPSC